MVVVWQACEKFLIWREGMRKDRQVCQGSSFPGHGAGCGVQQCKNGKGRHAKMQKVGGSARKE